jgi:hypothetical protein
MLNQVNPYLNCFPNYITYVPINFFPPVTNFCFNNSIPGEFYNSYSGMYFEGN